MTTGGTWLACAVACLIAGGFGLLTCGGPTIFHEPCAFPQAIFDVGLTFVGVWVVVNAALYGIGRLRR